MTTKQTLTLFVVAVVLGIAAYWYSKSEEKMLETAAPQKRPVLTGITSATVERIEIKVPEASLVSLTKRDAVWYTNVEKGHKADPNLVSNLFATLEKEIEGEVVSENPEYYSEYNVDETSATRVKVFGKDNKVLADLYVGKAGSSFFTTFVRRAGEKEVLSANASLTYVFNKPEGWRDKSIFNLNIDDIVEVRGELTSGALLVKKVAGIWKLEQPVARDAQMSKLQPFLSSIANLRATKFVEDETTKTLADFGLDPPKQKLTVVYEDRSTSPPKLATKVLLLGGPTEENFTTYYYVKRADSDDVFKITEYQWKMLSPDPKDLAVAESQPTSPATSAAETTSSAVRAADEATTLTASSEETTTPQMGEETSMEAPTTGTASEDQTSPTK